MYRSVFSDISSIKGDFSADKCRLKKIPWISENKKFLPQAISL